MSDINNIKRGLAARAHSVAEMLLPAGKKSSNEWEVGSLSGEPGKSLKVHLTGEKAGIWCDFDTGEVGDLIDLWMKTSGKKLIEVLDEARKYLGMEQPKAFREKAREYTRPPKPKCAAPKGKVLDYLRENRNISSEAITAYKVAEAGDKIIFPFLNTEGELCLAKARVAADGQKSVPTAKDCEPILFGWQAIPDDAREVTITEGEIDALSMFDYGYPALSVPFGGGAGKKQQWIENEYDNLLRFEKIYLALDMDETGEDAVAELARRLGRHRCVRVKLPRKDANDCLIEGVSRTEINIAMSDAQPLDPEGLKRASSFASKVESLFYPGEGEHVGYSMPYSKLGLKLLFRPGELTLWSGKSGDGKSQILSDCQVEWVKQGARMCISSLEMKAAQSLKRMVKQASGMDRPSPEFIHKTLGWLDTGVIMYELVGKASVNVLLDVFDYARAKYGCDVFIIDSLMRLGVPSDDFVGQEKIVYQIVEWAQLHNVHIHLVAHARKSMDGGPASIEDVKGASEIGANAFNVLTIWRNRKREDEIEKEKDDDKRKELIEEKPTVLLTVAKQRNGDWEGKCGLWFDQNSYRYRSSQDSFTSRNYVTFIEAKEEDYF
jgi:twinkle protein